MFWFSRVPTRVIFVARIPCNRGNQSTLNDLLVFYNCQTCGVWGKMSKTIQVLGTELGVWSGVREYNAEYGSTMRSMGVWSEWRSIIWSTGVSEFRIVDSLLSWFATPSGNRHSATPILPYSPSYSRTPHHTPFVRQLYNTNLPFGVGWFPLDKFTSQIENFSLNIFVKKESKNDLDLDLFVGIYCSSKNGWEMGLFFNDSLISKRRSMNSAF